MLLFSNGTWDCILQVIWKRPPEPHQWHQLSIPPNLGSALQVKSLVLGIRLPPKQVDLSVHSSSFLRLQGKEFPSDPCQDRCWWFLLSWLSPGGNSWLFHKVHGRNHFWLANSRWPLVSEVRMWFQWPYLGFATGTPVWSQKPYSSGKVGYLLANTRTFTKLGQSPCSGPLCVKIHFHQ